MSLATVIIALLWFTAVMALIWLFWNAERGDKVLNKLWWLIPVGAVLIALCWASGLADGTSLLK